MSKASPEYHLLPSWRVVAHRITQQRSQKRTLFLGLLLALGSPIAAAAVPGDGNCNQLGREIALRAAEEMNLAFDRDARIQLAAIAESACVSYALSSSDAPMAASSADTSSGQETEKSNGLFDIELIAPEDRVRRPGLKRR